MQSLSIAFLGGIIMRLFTFKAIIQPVGLGLAALSAILSISGNFWPILAVFRLEFFQEV